MLMEEHLNEGPVDIDKGTILHGDVIFDIPEPAAFKRYSTYQHQHLRWGLTSSWWPFWPALGPSCLLVFAFHALRALKQCDPRSYLMIRALRVLDTRLVLEIFCPTRTRLGPNTTRTE